MELITMADYKPDGTKLRACIRKVYADYLEDDRKSIKECLENPNSDIWYHAGMAYGLRSGFEFALMLLGCDFTTAKDGEYKGLIDGIKDFGILESVLQ